jgi:hypothetical protein
MTIGAPRRASIAALSGLLALAVAATFWMGRSRQSSADAGRPVGWSIGADLPAAYPGSWDVSYAYFPPLEQVVLFGGSPKKPGESWSDTTWILQNGQWLAGPSAPSGLTPRGGTAMAYLPEIGKIVLFGGGGPEWPQPSDTWLYDGAGWSKGPSTPSGLTGRTGARMVYDPHLHQLVLFGGSGARPYPETWLFDGTTWTPGPAAPAGMKPRVFFGMAYDPVQQKVIAAGGDGGVDTWLFDGTAWTPGPPLDPGPKERFSMAWDPQLGSMVIFGGLGPGSATNTMWWQKGTKWAKIPRSSTNQRWPGKRLGAWILWVPSEDALLVAGGIKDVDGGRSEYKDATFFREVPPGTPSLTVTPANPDQTMSLTATPGPITGGYKQVTSTYQWFVNGLAVSTNAGTAYTLTPASFVRGDQVQAHLLLTDALGKRSQWVWSNVVTILDRPPSIGSASIAPSPIGWMSSPLQATASGVKDPDEEPVALHYAWLVNGLPAGGDSDTLSTSQFAAGDTVKVTISTVDSFGMAGGSATSSPVSIKWNITAGSAFPGGLVPVNGGGFQSGESVALWLDSPTGTKLATLVADTGGGLPFANVAIPSPLPGGSHMVYGVGATSGTVGPGPMTVTPAATVDPKAVAAGDSVTFSGIGYVPGEEVSVSLPGGTPAVKTADSTGSLTATLTSPPIPFPTANATGAAPSGTASDKFNVTAMITIPGTGVPQQTATMRLTGYQAGETVEVKFDGTASGQSFPADAAGSVTASLTLDMRFGIGHLVTAVGRSSGVSKAAKIDLPATMSISPTSGVVGTRVTVDSGPGWAAGESIQVLFGAGQVGSGSADANGILHTSFVVPQHAAGGVTVKLKESAVGLIPTATFTIENNPPIISGASVSPTIPFTTTPLTAVASGVSDPDQQTVTLHYAWTVDDAPVGTDSPSLPQVHFTGGDAVSVTISTVDSDGMAGGTATASPVTIRWNLTATAPGFPGGSLGLRGAAFGPGESVALHLDSVTGPVLATLAADVSGALPFTSVTLPAPLTGGVHMLFGTGQISGIVGPGPMTVVPTAAVSPKALTAGDPTTLTGLGFVPGEAVSASFPGGSPTVGVADGTGTVRVTLPSPMEPWPGGNVTASAPSGSASDSFTVTTTFSLPTTGAPQTSVPIALTGYGPGESVDLSFDGGPAVESIATDASGSFSGSILLDMRFGTGHTVRLLGRSSAVSKTAKIDLPATMSVSPGTGPVGTTVFVDSGPGWASGEAMTILFGADTVGHPAADAAGVVHTTFVAPNHALGSVVVKVKGSVVPLTASAAFGVTSGSGRTFRYV